MEALKSLRNFALSAAGISLVLTGSYFAAARLAALAIAIFSRFAAFWSASAMLRFTALSALLSFSISLPIGVSSSALVKAGRAMAHVATNVSRCFSFIFFDRYGLDFESIRRANRR